MVLLVIAMSSSALSKLPIVSSCSIMLLQAKAGYIDARPLYPRSSNLLATHGRTIHSGHERTFSELCATSALPPKADIVERDRHLRFVRVADIHAVSTNLSVSRDPRR
jgi:hypothetical protein